MPMTLTTRAALLGSTLLASLAASGAWAQEAPSQLDELVVTGSRIPRPNLDQPTPVATLSTAIIENSGPQNLGDILTQLPAAGFSGTVRANSNNFGNGAGIS